MAFKLVTSSRTMRKKTSIVPVNRRMTSQHDPIMIVACRSSPRNLSLLPTVFACPTVAKNRKKIGTPSCMWHVYIYAVVGVQVIPAIRVYHLPLQ